MEKESLEEEVKIFIKGNIKVKVEIKTALDIGRKKDKNMMVVENWKLRTNKEIMVRKKYLKKKITIDDDVTKKEKKIIQKLREIARKEREKDDKKVKVKGNYRKIYLVMVIVQMEWERKEMREEIKRKKSWRDERKEEEAEEKKKY